MHIENYAPQETIIGTAKSVLSYLRHNIPLFWHFAKIYAPYIAGVHILVLALDLAGVSPPWADVDVADIISYYFLTCFAITWHRVTIFGPRQARHVEPFAPQRGDLVFIGVGLGLGFTFGIGVGLLAALGTIGVLPLLAWIIVGVFVLLRLAFYFPARAVDAGVSLKDAFALSRGYVGRLMGSSVLVSFVLFIPAFLYALIAAIIIAIFGGGSAVKDPGPLARIVETLVTLPIDVFITPLMMAGSVMVLSNFYLYAVGHARPRG